MSPAMAAAAAIAGRWPTCATTIARPERAMLTFGRCSNAPPIALGENADSDECTAAACLV